jgi:NADH:ubiquinone oxidoreductase subunit K
MIPLSWYLVFSAALFCIGLFGVLARKNSIAILIGIELMLNAVNVNMIAFWRYLFPDQPNGLVFVAVIFAVAAAETAVGLALIISAYRRRKTVVAEEINELKG